MEKALISHGNSPAIVIDKPVLDLLQITADPKIEVTTNGDSIMLTPVRDSSRQEATVSPAGSEAEVQHSIR
jgi:antitoxin component of MazEF toxin-antitoxin module